MRDSTPNAASPREQANGDAVLEREPPQGGSVDPSWNQQRAHKTDEPTRAEESVHSDGEAGRVQLDQCLACWLGLGPQLDDREWLEGSKAPPGSRGDDGASASMVSTIEIVDKMCN